VLPPANLDIPLDIQTLGMNYDKEVEHIELDEVSVRKKTFA
jgi:hypothetical protein